MNASCCFRLQDWLTVLVGIVIALMVPTINMDPNTGSPKYNARQMDRALKKMRDKKHARQQAQAEEQQYVEYRKKQILAAHAPRVGTLRSGDDAFPKRRRGLSMGFGERKAHFLAIRPNPKYATWFGKKKGALEAKPMITPTAVQLTDHSTVPDKLPKAEEHPAVKPSEKEANTPAASKPSVPAASTKEPRIPSEKLGNRADNVMDNGILFWIATGNDADEVTDEDLPVDMEVLERVCNGEIQLHQKPFHKTNFNPYGPVQRFKFDDSLFVRDTVLFTNTVESVISLQPDEMVEYAKPAPFTPMIRWADKIVVQIYDPLDHERKVSEPVVEDMKDVKREKVEKK
ncbi:hypothetical protein M3Y94_00471100 [Aphelenchoides besseyi]|nr:hypothetical protein M3Y94_00471100 [Aphelenchoides besseyi]